MFPELLGHLRDHDAKLRDRGVINHRLSIGLQIHPLQPSQFRRTKNCVYAGGFKLSHFAS